MDPLAGLFLAVDRRRDRRGLALRRSATPATAPRRHSAPTWPSCGALGVVPLAANVMTFLDRLGAHVARLVDARRRSAGTSATARRAGVGIRGDDARRARLPARRHAPARAPTRAASASPTGARPPRAARPACATRRGCCSPSGFAGKAGVDARSTCGCPLAHPAAPSHVSALMSGVMIKLGVYGLLRAGFEWLGAGTGRGGASSSSCAGAGLGARRHPLRAGRHDLKRLLAFSQHREHRHHPDRRRRRACSSARAGRRDASRSSRWWPRSTTRVNHAVQGAALPRRGRGGARDRHPQHGGDGRPDQADAVDARRASSLGVDGDRGAPAARTASSASG